MTQTKWYWVGGIVLVAAAGAFFFFDFRHRTSSLQGETASTTDLGSVQVETSGGGSATITPIPVAAGSGASTVPEPSLDRPITFTGSPLPPDAQTIVKAQMETIIASLKKDPTQLNMWLQLGIDRKQAGDYEGARQAWAYVSAVAPADEISVADLADLFANFIKDYPQAEAYYLKAIAAAPQVIDNYRNLYTLYHYSYKVGTGADVAILKTGLKNNPGNPDLTQMLSAAQ